MSHKTRWSSASSNGASNTLLKAYKSLVSIVICNNRLFILTNIIMLDKQNSNINVKKHNPYYVGFVDLLAGSLGGAATVAVGQPLDTVKVKMQTFPETYPNAIKCFVTTFKNEGLFRGLYAGTTPSLAANVGENAVLFCAYGYSKKFVSAITGRHGQDMTVIDKASSGFFAAFFSSFALCPTELIKCKLQAIKETNSEPISASELTKKILREQGIRGLYNGLTTTIAREMPGYFAFFLGIESTKVLLTRYTRFKDESHPMVSLLAGGVGGMCLWLAIFPFDLVKSRIQIENSKSSLSQMLTKIVREEGPRTLYRGLTPTLIRTFPATAALLYTIEQTKLFLL